MTLCVFLPPWEAGLDEMAEQEVLEINWLYKNQGSKTFFICSNHNPLDLHFVLCLSNQTFPEENLILLGPICTLRAQATWPTSISPHYHWLHWFRDQIPRAHKMDHSIIWAINPENWLIWPPLGWAGEWPALWQGWPGPGKVAAPQNLLFQKPFRRSLARVAGRCENRSQGWGRRLGNSILNRFNLKKEPGYLTLCKNLTPHGALRETPASQLCCHTLNPHPEC